MDEIMGEINESMYLFFGLEEVHRIMTECFNKENGQ
jgi:hypothetical protein